MEPMMLIYSVIVWGPHKLKYHFKVDG